MKVFTLKKKNYNYNFLKFQIIQYKIQKSKYFFFIKMKHKDYRYLIGITLVCFFIFINEINTAACTRQRCCLLDPCTSDYCIQKNSQSWISTQNFLNYQFTKLVLSNNQCKPCSYDCKICSSETVCTTCAKGFYLDSSTSTCLLCSDRCLSCTVVNSITKCSSCQDGTYLDSTTLTCKSCPQGAKTCSSSTAIIQCSSGYKKSSNSLYCTSCPLNCLTCPISDTVCTSCSSGYYLNSSSCAKCTLPNCLTCLRISSNVLCTGCNSGFILQSGACVSCPSNCRTCSSSSVCTVCNSGYYIVGGACSLVSTTISNCQLYSGVSTCSSCASGYYLKSSLCYSCSLLCSTCDGSHFGQCLTCNSNSALFNKMCLITNFPSTSTYNLFYSFPSSYSLIASGSLSCSNQYVMGSSITLNLNNLKGSKIQVSWKLYSRSGSTTYSAKLSNLGGNTILNYTTSNSLKFDNLCDNDTSTFYHLDIQRAQTFSSIKKLNTLTISTDNSMTLALHQVIVTVYRCNQLCIECSQTLCTQCLMTKLYTQDAYCVYTCGNNYYIYLNSNSTTNPKQCLSQCPLGTYTLTSNVSCASCKSPCLTCLNQLFCLSCVDGYYLTKQNTCNQTCPYKYYGKIQTKTCQKCIGRCLQCISQDKCLSCKIGFLQNTTKSCVDSCAYSVTSLVGIYADLSTLYCQNCNASCLNCIYKKTYCIQCSNITYLFDNQCLAACPSKYYAPTGSNICKSCQYPCKNCQTTSINCISCIQGYLYNNTCINDCPTGYFQDNVNLICIACDSKCLECYGSSTYCLSCNTGFFYQNYFCYSSCPATYFSQNSTGFCADCVNLCRTCVNQTYCLSCKSNFLHQGQCLTSGQCPTGYYADITTLSCQPCSYPCLQCQYSSTYCIKCNISNPSGLVYLQSNTCKNSCSSVYFYAKNNGTVATCQPCVQPCLTCLNGTACLSCISGYKYSSNVCSSTCSIGTFFNLTLNDCQNCSNNCQICTDSKICQICKSNFYISSISSNQNQCVSVCSSGFYGQSLSLSCQKCIYPCLTCLSSIDCLSCLSGVSYQNRCISSCPDSTYLNITTNECVSCQGNCLTCSSDPLYCQSCKNGFYLYYSNHTCLISCPASYYGEQLTKSCLQCPSTCSSCINSTYCNACIYNKTYKSASSNICVQFCPSGTFGNDTSLNCDSCSSKCLTCKYSASNCLSCTAGYLFIKLTYNLSDCQLTCPSGYYPQSSYCYQCSFPCKTCTTSAKCLTCIQGTFYHKNSSSCLMNCPSDTFYNFTGLLCDSCIFPCQSCDSAATNCLSCSNSNGTLYFYKGTCVSSCPSNYYADESGICNKCYGLCSTCSNKYFCLTCLAGYVYDGFCYSSCPLGTFANTTVNSCQPCNSTCTQCVLQSTYCTKCSGGLYVYKGNCSVTCPTGTYEDNSQCKTCTFPCINCNGLNSCNQCLGGYLLYMNISCIPETILCPNDFYKMDSKYCVPVTWCPANYFIDQTLKTCSVACDRKKYTNVATKKCQSSCSAGWYAGVNLVCSSWSLNLPVSLMSMNIIRYVQSSYMYLQVIFNQTVQWIDVSTDMYTFSLVQTRLLINSEIVPQYVMSLQNPISLKLKPSDYPQRMNVNLPAYRVKSSVTSYPLQNPTVTINLPTFTAYSNFQIYSGVIMGQFSQGISWFIILLSFFYLFKNRLSDLYVLWDTVQLLYLLIFLEIQYPPNLNEFFKGLKYTHFTFIPSIFSQVSTRKISDSPFYAYSYDNSFTRNTGGIFLALILVFGILIVFKFLQYLIKKLQKVRQKMKQYPQIKGFIYKGSLRYRWHHSSDFFFLTYDIMMLFAIAQINYIQNNPGYGFSNALAVLTCLSYILWVVFVGYKLSKHFKNISQGKMVNNLKCFYRGIQRQNKFGISLVLIRYGRKLFYCMIISLFSKNPMFALPILMFSSILMCLFLSINVPYKKKLSNIINIGAEVVLVIVYILIAFINFNNQTFDSSLKQSLGWICCCLLALMIFALIFEIFCKTMFHLQPQINTFQKKVQNQAEQKMLNDKQKQYLRKKAYEFFDSILPRLRQKLNFDQDSDDQLYNNYEQGDSQNSQNNEQRQKNWNESQSHNSQQFKHYDNSQHSEDPTAINSKIKINQAPQYLVRCVKDIQ